MNRKTTVLPQVTFINIRAFYEFQRFTLGNYVNILVITKRIIIDVPKYSNSLVKR